MDTCFDAWSTYSSSIDESCLMSSNRFPAAPLQTRSSAFSGTTAGSSERRSSYNSATSAGKKGTVFNSSTNPHSILQPARPRHIDSVSQNGSNYVDVSKVDVLEHNSITSGWTYGADCRSLDDILSRTIAVEDNHEPRLLALLITLEASRLSTYGYQASISQRIADKVFEAFECHSSFREDLVGRPDYWSAFSNEKLKAGASSPSDYEFYCQHSRWLQEIRWDKQQPRPPCSVYMHHSERLNLTLYLISAEPVDVCMTQLKDSLLPVNGKPHPAIRTAAESPFYLHTMINGLVFELSQAYVADIKNRLKKEIGRVNDWAENPSSNVMGTKDLVTRGQEIRLELESITKALHLISQNSDTGIANANMSIKVNEAMVQAHQQYACEQFWAGPTQQHSSISTALQETTASLDFLGKSWITQKGWLVSYKARKDTSMSFVFNAVTQQDSATNVDIALKMARDSSSMHTITILTMIFLPGTFIAGVFDSGIITSERGSKYYVSGLFVPFICVVVCLTLTTICFWLWRRQLYTTLKLSMSCVGVKRRRNSLTDIEKGR